MTTQKRKNPSGKAAAKKPVQAASREAVTAGGEEGGEAGRVYQIKVTLRDSKPPIWRRLLVPVAIRLDTLHWVLQIAMGWTNSHLHQFIHGDRYSRGRGAVTYYSLPDFELGELGEEVHDESRVRLNEVVSGPGDKLIYEYDFGDSWEHILLIEKELPREAGMHYPVCIAGKQAGPLEDSGGVWGYAELVEILRDPQHPQYEDMSEWAPPDFDPDAFDLDEINRQLQRLSERPGDVQPLLGISLAIAASRQIDEPVESPSLDEWRRLYEAAIRFKELAPWEWMWDEDLFGIKHPESDEIGYCCIMGNLGEHLALAVYQGAEGLAGYLQTASGGVPANPVEALALQQCLMASFEDREMVDKEDRAIMKQLGLKFRGSQEWPLFRSYRPGYQPWFLTRDEARFLTLALEQAIEVARRVQDDPDLLGPERDVISASLEDELHQPYLVRVAEPGVAGRSWHDLQWHDEWLSPAPLTPAPLTTAPVDATQLEKLAATAQRTAQSWEVDFFFTPQAVKEEEDERPFFPLTVLVADQQSGTILGVGLSKPFELTSALVQNLLGLMQNTKRIPQRILVQRAEGRTLLEPMATQLGIELVDSERLQALEAAQASLFAFMGDMGDW
ncbi:MAG: plasmid pRiA4b ORF-3 family protein [Armatimonadota bacterium]|nr:plasmid pRiA4b ORF-3 family protein [Armatimonadota bacterium]